MKRFLMSFYFFLFTSLAFAQNGRSILIDNASRYDIRSYGYFYEDKSLNATIDTLVKLKYSGKLSELTPGRTFNKGFTQSYWWIVFDLQNSLNEPVHLFFNERSNSINRLQLFKVDSAGKITAMALTGDHFKFNSRPIPYHNYLYPIKLKANEKATYFLWADKRGQNMVMPLGLAKDVDLVHAEIPFYTIFGIFVGIYFFAILFNIFLFISLRDKIHLYYAFYVTCILVFNLEDEGLAFQWIYPNIPLLQDYLRNIIAFISSGLLVQIMLLFINQNSTNSKFYGFINGYKMCCYALAILPLGLLIFGTNLQLEKINFYTANFIALLTVIILILNTAERIIKGYKLAWYYLVAMLILLLGILNYIFNALGITNYYAIEVTTGLVVGLTAEIIFLSFALTQRYNFLKSETKILQHEKTKLQVALVNDVFEAQENERRRLAQDLHDDLGGTLSAIKLNVTAFKANIVELPPENHTFYAQTIRMIENACENLREISHNLMPKDLGNSGLINTLTEQFLELNQNGNIVFEFIHDINSDISAETELTIYRIIKELTNNIIKHAVATKASLQIISSSEQIVIMCEDNGIGFDANPNCDGIGLANIKLRVSYLKGVFRLESNKMGTSISIFIPNQEDHGA